MHPPEHTKTPARYIQARGCTPARPPLDIHIHITSRVLVTLTVPVRRRLSEQPSYWQTTPSILYSSRPLRQTPVFMQSSAASATCFYAVVCYVRHLYPCCLLIHGGLIFGGFMSLWRLPFSARYKFSHPGLSVSQTAGPALPFSYFLSRTRQ